LVSSGVVVAYKKYLVITKNKKIKNKIFFWFLFELWLWSSKEVVVTKKII
jgi:hypothetical protein